ncbi:DUF4393 domain-containing protein [Vagococcus jeotgali]|uniref:DUF4393 domain-containing protein n=1 Tax=Vagococcus jeotgali TaxID=3109030 RepID=UPI002DDC5F1B|nr:DUF4393 domain-containing protein [Vagococcus sp. B2T-5]
MTDEKSIIKINVLPEKTTDALLTPGATSIGSAFKDVIEALGHATLGPLRKFNLVKEKELKDFEEQLNSKINDIPEENRDDSKIGITFKALEDSKYQLNEDIMREAFSNLISNSLDSRTNSLISPKYSDILANMSSNEAKLFQTIYQNNLGRVPVISVDIENINTRSSRRAADYILILNDKRILQDEQLSLSLLEASNLIRINEGKHWAAPHFISLYDYVENEKVNLDSFNDPNFDEEKAIVNKHSLELTHLGLELAKLLFP